MSINNGPASLCCAPLVAAPLSEDDAVALAALLKVLADPTRLQLLSLVARAAGGETCACDLAAPLGKSQPTVSHHLTSLVKAGLLTREQRGRWAWFRLTRPRLAELCRALDPDSRGSAA